MTRQRRAHLNVVLVIEDLSTEVGLDEDVACNEFPN